ncbi:MAG: helix-turn-helix domain-containing protein [Candidatus Howiella sp.]|jgi:putative transcriptional regulator
MSIKELRKETGMSQSKFAEKFEIPVRTLQKWEIGERTPPSYINKMIEKILEMEKR